MNTIEIIKKSFMLPFKAYKGFILVTLLFFACEMVTDLLYRTATSKLTIVEFTITLIIYIIALGVSVAIVYHYIDDSFNIREISIKTTAKAGINDIILECYYYILAIGTTVILTRYLGLYDNMFTVLDNIVYVEQEFVTAPLPEFLNFISPLTLTQFTFSFLASLAIFVILFALFFSYCSFGKIRLTETGNLIEGMNIIKITKIIIKKGIIRYLGFIILTFTIFMTVFLIMKTLDAYLLIGSIISAMTESFALFFILDSFSLFYYY